MDMKSLILLLALIIFPLNSQATQKGNKGLHKTKHNAVINWEEVYNSSARCFAINSKGHLFAGTWGVLRSEDNGDNWTRIELPNTSYEINSLAVNSEDDIFATTYDDHIYRSEDDGKSWIQLYTDSSDISFNYVAINSADEIFIGTNNGLVHSMNDGNGFELTGWYDESNPTKEVELIAISPNDNIFIDAGYAGICRSVDNGVNWECTSSGLKNMGINAITFNSKNNIFTGGAGPDGAVFISTNNGDTWSKTGYAFQTSYDSVVTAIFINSADEIFAGSFGGGIFYSSDNGNTWTEANTGIPKDPVYGYPIISSFIFNAENHILASTSTGIFRSSLPVIAIEPLNLNKPAAFILEQNYPNPFNPVTTIRYELPVPCHADVSVYNMLGQKVATLVSEKQPAGSYEMQWDASKFPSGLYLYRLKSDIGFSMTKKLILLK
jgi:photosystem II stability/assembly factor-like uncharacterized protein